MIWEAALEPRIVHLKEYLLPRCYHQLRCVRSDTVIADRCVDDIQLGGTCCDPKYDIRDPSDPDFENLDYTIEDQMFDSPPYLWPALGLKTDLPVPSLLHASRESRRAALKFYTLSFATLGSKPQVYFNFELDTLYLNESSFDRFLSYDDYITGALLDFCHEERTRIQHVALATQILGDSHEDQMDIFCEFMSAFRNVESVTFVPGEYTNKSLNKGTALQTSSLAFVYPIDMGRRVYMLQNPDFHVHHNEQRLPRETWYDLIDTWDIDVWRSRSRKPTWPLPLISHRIVTTSAIKANFEQLKQKYERTSDCRCYEERDWDDDKVEDLLAVTLY